MSSVLPNDAPMCFGRQYEDHDQECQGCDYRMSCKPEYLRGNGMMAPQPHHQPQQPQQQAPWPYYQHRTPSAPAPAPVPIAPAPYLQKAPQVRLPMIQSPQQMQAVPPPAVPVQATQSQLPTVQMFNPYFQQYYQPYAGENTMGRVGTHICLRLGYTLFSELAKFCEVWRPEPPSGI